MVRAEHPRDYAVQAGPVDADLLSIDDDESEESESADSCAGYGSLLSLGSGMRKKRPSLVLDPVEAENEARRVQYVAAQQFAGGDEPATLEFLESLAALAEPIGLDACEAAPESADPAACTAPGDADGADEAAAPDVMVEAEDVVVDSVDDAGDDRIVPASSGEADFWVFSGALAGLAERPERAVPHAIDDAASSDETGDVDPVAVADEPLADPITTAIADPPRAPRRPGHSLRARVPGSRPRRSFGDRLAIALRWLSLRLARGRKS